MSDGERDFSEDDGGSLFESDPEDQNIDVGNSVGLPALSLESSYSKPRSNAGGDDDVPLELTGVETDASGAGGFDISESDLLMANPAPLSTQMTRNDEDREFANHKDPVGGDEDGEKAENELVVCDDDTEHSNIEAGSKEVVGGDQSSLLMPQCDSPQISALNDEAVGDDKEQTAYEAKVDVIHEVCCDDGSIQNADPSALASTSDTSNDIGGPSPVSCEEKLAENSSRSNPAPPEPTQATTMKTECEDTTTEFPANEVSLAEQQQTDVVETASGGISKAPMYTVETLFPVVYERSVSLREAPTENAKVVPISTSAKISSRDQRRQLTGDKSTNCRLAALQSQLDAARAELKNATRTFKLQLSMAETDNKKLSQRNARLKNQLSVVTADLQRSSAEMAKLKTENELYAAKLPRLQAELLEETSQVDETQAQSVQTQLALTQLKARSHVLQTRNIALEAQNNKLTQQLRELQQQLQRKAAALQQQTEKATKLEADMNELKTAHIQDKIDCKSRMTCALQRFERDKTKLETAVKSQDRKELREAKDRAERAVKKRQAADTAAAKLEAQLKHCKHELSAASKGVQHQTSQSRTSAHSMKTVRTLLLALLGAGLLAACVVEAIVAGVDFGGEFFKVALVKPGTPFEIVTNVHSKRKTETLVAFDGDERLYGADAATVGVRRPQTAYAQIRRLLGTTLRDPQVSALLDEEHFPYQLLQNATRGGTVSLQHGEDRVFHAEELVAMVFAHARQITDTFAEAPVKDWVLTVPAFFSQAQRQAMLDAAEISGVRVLSLINENTAAALQLAVHASYDPQDKPKRILFYNLGSTSLQVSVAEFSSQVVPDGFKKNKTISTFQTLSNAWDETLGGAKFDLRMAEHLAKEFSDKIGQDIRKVPRPMAKIRAQAKKTKTVLSANEEIPVVMQSLYNDIDFFTSMTRSKLEEMSADLFERTLKPVEVALEKAGLTVADIDEIELIGGGVRMPKIQQQLSEFFDGKDLGVHLNGDEAMALGAAFRAANLSNSFRVRQVGMTDIASYPIGVRLVDLSATEAKENDNNDDEVETKQWMKRASLFSESHRLGLRKSVSFSHSNDVSCTFRYDKPSMLPAGVSVQIGKFNITGVEKFVARMADKNLGEPKVTLSFELDSNGIAQIAKAEATLEEEVEVEVPVKKEKKSKKSKKEEASGDSSEAGDKDEAEEEEEEKVETRTEKQTKTHRERLTVVRAYETHEPEEGMSVLPMSETVKKESMRMLTEMEKADNKRRANLEAKNSLETFIYKAHDALSAQESQIKEVTVPEQVESLQTKLEETEEWLYDDGDKVDAAEYKKKMDALDSDLSAILFRVAESKELPIAINTAQEYAFSTRELMNEWSTSKPQVTDEERSDVIEKLDELEAWLTESEASQKAAPKHEKPVVTSADVAKKVQGVKKFVAVLAKRPKPQPVKTDKNDTEKDGSKAEEETSSKEAGSEKAEPKVETEKETEDDAESADEKDEL
ncbi:Heat shock protein 17 [Phytophthora rubi]|uniref:Heat shock protein 17 n=2 Tax=Phytophthora rubi TaxID=129364 RepID=A0A6A4F1B1_9STRA|nr:Heat shock protein 17 [Phytophthora rubi]